MGHETIRYWWHRFGSLFAAEVRKRRINRMKSSRWRWHLDEIFVGINGEMHYLWRAIDHEGDELGYAFHDTLQFSAPAPALFRGRPRLLPIWEQSNNGSSCTGSVEKAAWMAGAVRTEAYRTLLRALVGARATSGLSQADLAMRLGKPPSFVAKYELGERRLDVVVLLVILRALEAEPEDLLSGLLERLPEKL